MLFYQTIDSPTLGLLKKIQGKECFKDLRLVGGTSLALQIGHRKSVDLDLFGTIIHDEIEVLQELHKIGEIKILTRTTNINVYVIDAIKVDIVNYPYPWIESVIVNDGIKLADMKDIAAMKLAAITNRGTKKDFIDIYFLLKYFSLKQLLGFYNKKFSDGSEFLVLKSLSFFDDADNDENPLMLSEFNWGEIKKSLKIEITRYAGN